MKITGPDNIKKPAEMKKARKAGNASDVAAFSAMLSDVTESGAVAASEPVQLTAGIISALPLGYDSPERKRQIKRGNDMLDKLDIIRLEILSGTIDRDSLLALRSSLKDSAGRVGDNPELAGLIEEIETRVAVELAKLGISM